MLPFLHLFVVTSQRLQQSMVRLRLSFFLNIKTKAVLTLADTVDTEQAMDSNMTGRRISRFP